MRIIRDGQFWLLCLPGLLLTLIFSYVPMLGIITAFKDYSITQGIFQSPWVGAQWFIKFFNSPYFWRVLRNTLLLSLYTLLFTFPFPIAFALLLNEIRNRAFKRAIQTISYMPHFISTVIVVGIMINMLSPTSGVVNQILLKIGMVAEPINFFYEPGYFRPLYVASEVWQHYGWNSIIYLATLSSIDPQLYEAAEMDGAGKWMQLVSVTLPGLRTVMVTLLVLSFGSLMSVGFEKVLLMYRPATYETGDVISTYVYRVGIVDDNVGYGVAVGLFNSVVNLLLLVAFNFVSRKLSEVSLW